VYRRSLQPRWREIAVSILVIAVLLPAAGFLAGDVRGPGEGHQEQHQEEDLRSIYLVNHRLHARVMVRQADGPDMVP
jgi:hypothetical protein